MSAFETKQTVLSDIARLIGRPTRPVARGSTEPKEAFTDIVEQLGLPISGSLRKPHLAQAIVEYLGFVWDADCDSRDQPSGGGDTVTLAGLRRVRAAVETHLTRYVTPPRLIAEDASHESVSHGTGEIALRPFADRAPTIRADAFELASNRSSQREVLLGAVRGHANLLRDLVALMKSTGATCEEDPSSVDLVATWPERATLLLEAKTVSDEPVVRARIALAQLYEYAYRLHQELRAPVVLVLALDRPLGGPIWLGRYLLEDRRINLLWRDGDGFATVGPDEGLMRQLIPALRRMRYEY